MYWSEYVPRRCEGNDRICLEGVCPFLLPHNGHREERAVCRHGGKAARDSTIHGEAGLDIGSVQSTDGCRCDPVVKGGSDVLWGRQTSC